MEKNNTGNGKRSVRRQGGRWCRERSHWENGIWARIWRRRGRELCGWLREGDLRQREPRTQRPQAVCAVPSKFKELQAGSGLEGDGLGESRGRQVRERSSRQATWGVRRRFIYSDIYQVPTRYQAPCSALGRSSWLGAPLPANTSPFHPSPPCSGRTFLPLLYVTNSSFSFSSRFSLWLRNLLWLPISQAEAGDHYSFGLLLFLELTSHGVWMTLHCLLALLSWSLTRRWDI